MIRYAALLRGINVGGNKKVPMAVLREALDGLGFRDVATLLQSGNAVFSAKDRDPSKVVKRLEEGLRATFGFEIPVLVRTAEELSEVIARNPLEGADEAPSKFLVVFLAAPPPKDRLERVKTFAHGGEELALVGRELYARLPNGIGTSKLGGQLSGTSLGVTATARNWATVLKLRELCGAG